MPFALHITKALRKVFAVVTEDLELAFALLHGRVVDAIGIELLVDPAHDADFCDAIDFAGARPVGQPVQGVQGRVAGREPRSLRGKRRGHAERGGYSKEMAHWSYMLTLPLVRS